MFLHSSLVGFVLSVLLIVGVIGFVNFGAVKNFFAAGRSQVGKIGRLVINADPMANYKQTIDDEAEKLNQARQDLAEAGVLVRTVQRQVDTGRADKTRLGSRIQSLMSSGDHEKARIYAEQLVRVEEELASNELQLAKHKATQERAKALIAAHSEKLRDARRESSSLELQLKMAKQTVATQKTLNATSLDSSSMDSQRDRVLEEIDRYESQAEMNGIGVDEVAKLDAEEREDNLRAATDDVLARFQS